MASTGQASMHFTQPMHSRSSMTATCGARCSPCAGLSGFTARPRSAASVAMPSSPPGGHWSISASPLAIASA